MEGGGSQGVFLGGQSRDIFRGGPVKKITLYKYKSITVDQVEDEYKKVNNGEWGWRALRLMSRW